MRRGIVSGHAHASLRARPQRHERRRISVDGTEVAYWDQNIWNGIATLAGLPATAMPIGASDQGLPIGMQIIGPYLEDRTPLAFAALMEGEFGGVVVPPAFKG